ncbi:battenin [Onthophagus taurus]|uniref:battenin n=1 Tax=Onthophagus taurus TaxID=166361 RepID=UPI000C20391A|nr:battenin [Onthophagus taurus]
MTGTTKHPHDAEYRLLDTEYKIKMNGGEVVGPEETPNLKKENWRNLVAYWILGLCNNYGYVVMLSAAKDILHAQTPETWGDEGHNSERDCNYMSTGAILLADILPCLVIKLIAPFLPFFVHVRVALCVLSAAGGLLLVAFSESQFMSIFGVVITSFSSGLGEVTYLQYSSFYHKNVISSWSSGTGGAGVIGALSYAALNKLGIRNALLIMLIVPVLMGVSFWFILRQPDEKGDVALQHKINKDEINDPYESFKKKLAILPGLMKFMIPLGLVYLFEYFINQGTFELINYDDTFIDHAAQYRWLQVDYQIGVFISRSSVNLIHIKNIWIMAILQLFNVAIFTTEAIFYYIPAFWVVLILTLWEGLLGGGAYVNTFYRISTEVSEENKQFSMATTSFADSVGITLAGIFAIFAHNAICDMPKPVRLTF